MEGAVAVAMVDAGWEGALGGESVAVAGSGWEVVACVSLFGFTGAEV